MYAPAGESSCSGGNARLGEFTRQTRRDLGGGRINLHYIIVASVLPVLRTVMLFPRKSMFSS